MCGIVPPSTGFLCYNAVRIQLLVPKTQLLFIIFRWAVFPKGRSSPILPYLPTY